MVYFRKKVWLMDVVVIRLALIILLVLYHSFCIYTGAWKVPYDNFHKIVGYDWIGMLSHQFRLQGMVFISGLLFGYNMTKKEKKELHFLPFILQKAKRILLPCLFFGIIYYLLFYDLSVSWTTIVYRIMNGCGHLWFLPMIFWCFIITYILAHYPPLLERRQIFYTILAVSCMLAVLNPLSFLPFGLGKVGHYYIYFLIGFLLKQNLISFPKDTWMHQLTAILIFCTAFIAYMILRDKWDSQDALIMNIIRSASFNICTLLTSLSAIYTFYNVSNRKKVINWLKSKPMLITLSGYCYGVYIYQQFILQYLYYKTNIPMTVNEYALPWIGFAVTLCLSLTLCWLTLKTRFGRFLIG